MTSAHTIKTVLISLDPGTAVPTSRRESDDSYHAVVAILNHRWRVIECRDGIQWILQFAKKRQAQTGWEGRSFCRTREALIRVCREHTGEIWPAALSILDALPVRIEGGRPDDSEVVKIEKYLTRLEIDETRFAERRASA